MTTSETLTLPGFEPMASTVSTPSAAGSPAKTSASRARVPAWTVSAPGSGESTRAFLANFDPATRSWKTSGLCGLEDLPQFSQTLPRSGSMRSGTLYLLPPLVHLTSVIVSGSSPLIPTPTASLGDKHQRGMPSAATAALRYSQGKRNLDDWCAMNEAGLLPTPQAEDWRTCADYSDGSRGHSPQLRHLGQGRLNPRFVEWMMGFPPGWTDVDSLD